MTDHPDIVERLTTDVLWLRRRAIAVIPDDLKEAAAEITRLRAEAEALKKDKATLREAIDRTWHVLKKHGRHPGRTDDTLWDCVDAAIAATKEQQA